MDIRHVSCAAPLGAYHTGMCAHVQVLGLPSRVLWLLAWARRRSSLDCSIRACGMALVLSCDNINQLLHAPRCMALGPTQGCGSRATSSCTPPECTTRATCCGASCSATACCSPARTSSSSEAAPGAAARGGSRRRRRCCRTWRAGRSISLRRTPQAKAMAAVGRLRPSSRRTCCRGGRPRRAAAEAAQRGPGRRRGTAPAAAAHLRCSRRGASYCRSGWAGAVGC